MKKKLTVVKIGGNVINDEVLLAKVLADFAALKEDKILIHGGGKRASALMRQMGMQPNMVEGRRITDAATLEVILIVSAGLSIPSLILLLPFPSLYFFNPRHKKRPQKEASFHNSKTTVRTSQDRSYYQTNNSHYVDQDVH